MFWPVISAIAVWPCRWAGRILTSVGNGFSTNISMRFEPTTTVCRILYSTRLTCTPSHRLKTSMRPGPIFWRRPASFRIIIISLRFIPCAEKTARNSATANRYIMAAGTTAARSLISGYGPTDLSCAERIRANLKRLTRSIWERR